MKNSNHNTPDQAHDFAQYLRQKGFTPATIRSTILRVNNFIANQDEPKNITTKHILNYLERLRDQNLKNTTINIYLRQIRYYFDYLKKSGHITTNPTKFIKIRGIKRRQLHRLFSTDELIQLADDYYHIYIRNHNLKPHWNNTEHALLCRHRNHGILGLLIHQGLPTSDIPLITPDDLDLIKATIRIPANNRSNARTLGLDATQIGALMRYIDQTRPQIITEFDVHTDRLFFPFALHAKEHPQKYANLFYNLKLQLQKIHTGFTGFHQIRTSVITAWIQTHGLRRAQYMAGHRYASSTENYLPNDIATLTEEIEKYHPY